MVPLNNQLGMVALSGEMAYNLNRVIEGLDRMEVRSVIRLYTYPYALSEGKKAINMLSTFRLFVLNRKLSEREIEIVERIDGSKFLGGDVILTKFEERTTIDHVSTGAKTALVLRWLVENGKQDFMLDISYCGNNVYPIIIEESGDRDVSFLTCNYCVFCDTKVSILLNDRYVLNSFREMAELGDRIYATSD